MTIYEKYEEFDLETDRQLEDPIYDELHKTYLELRSIFGDDLGDSIALQVIDQKNNIIYEEDCYDIGDSEIIIIDDDTLDKEYRVIKAEVDSDYYKDNFSEETQNIKKPCIILHVEKITI